MSRERSVSDCDRFSTLLIPGGGDPQPTLGESMLELWNPSW
jgi:hypothetical protein